MPRHHSRAACRTALLRAAAIGATLAFGFGSPATADPLRSPPPAGGGDGHGDPPFDPPQGQPPIAPVETGALMIGPVPGLTVGWHPAPRKTFIPLGTTALFKVAAEPDALVTWSGAVEIARDSQWSVATCPLNALGPAMVEVAVVQEKLYESECLLEVVADLPEKIALSLIDVDLSRISVDVDSPPELLNATTVGLYFGASVAKVTQLAKDLWRTSVDRPVFMRVDVDPAGFAPLIEWRLSSGATTLGDRMVATFADPGSHVVAVGPPDGQSTGVVETYRVTIVAPEAGSFLPDGSPIAFIAVTEPPGLESEITWLSATKYGSASPVLGAGPDFTATFMDTFGPLPGGGTWSWKGVKADNAVMGQDEKIGCGLTAHDCCTVGSPGCADTGCCQAVCAIDPFCCDTQWDSICVDEAASICPACAAEAAKNLHRLGFARRQSNGAKSKVKAFLFDTGADVSVLSRDCALAMGLLVDANGDGMPDASSGEIEVGGVGGAVKVWCFEGVTLFGIDDELNVCENRTPVYVAKAAGDAMAGLNIWGTPWQKRVDACYRAKTCKLTWPWEVPPAPPPKKDGEKKPDPKSGTEQPVLPGIVFSGPFGSASVDMVCYAGSAFSIVPASVAAQLGPVSGSIDLAQANPQLYTSLILNFMNQTGQQVFPVVTVSSFDLGIGPPGGTMQLLVSSDLNSDFGVLGDNLLKHPTGPQEFFHTAGPGVAGALWFMMADCDQNGVPDDDQIAADPGLDADGDSILDVCQAPSGAICFPDGSCVEGPEMLALAYSGATYLGDGVSCADVSCTADAGLIACPGDLDASGTVDGADLGILLGHWGDAGGPADLTGDGTVDGEDLGVILAAFGPCLQ